MQDGVPIALNPSGLGSYERIEGVIRNGYALVSDSLHEPRLDTLEVVFLIEIIV